MPLATLVAGALLGGLLLGAVLMLAWLALKGAQPVRMALVLGVGSLGAVAVVWTHARPWLPERPRQVSDTLMVCSLERAGFRWGVQLGLGVTTFVVTPALYPLLAVAAVQDTPAATAAICGLYGLSRGAVIAAAAVIYARTGRVTRGALIGSGLERATRLPTLLAIIIAVALSTI